MSSPSSLPQRQPRSLAGLSSISTHPHAQPVPLLPSAGPPPGSAPGHREPPGLVLAGGRGSRIPAHPAQHWILWKT